MWRRAVDRIGKLARILADIAREIFDENSYARYLARTGLADSCSAYAEFTREERNSRERRPRCC